MVCMYTMCASTVRYNIVWLSGYRVNCWTILKLFLTGYNWVHMLYTGISGTNNLPYIITRIHMLKPISEIKYLKRGLQNLISLTVGFQPFLPDNAIVFRSKTTPKRINLIS